MPFFTVQAGAITLSVRVTPKASRDAVVGTMPTTEGEALKVVVTAAPDKGKANAAVQALLAKSFGVAKSAVSIIAGETDRHKIVRVVGDPKALSGAASKWTKA